MLRSIKRQVAPSAARVPCDAPLAQSAAETLSFRAPAAHIPGFMQIHASCAAREGHGVLLLGPPGIGKSDLALRLLDHGFQLVSDDRVSIEDGVATAPAPLAGLLEVRGVGIVRLPYVASARLVLAVLLAGDPSRMERLPLPARFTPLDLPMVTLDPAVASAPARVALALDCALGRLVQVAGAFA